MGHEFRVSSKKMAMIVEGYFRFFEQSNGISNGVRLNPNFENY